MNMKVQVFYLFRKHQTALKWTHYCFSTNSEKRWILFFTGNAAYLLGSELVRIFSEWLILIFLSFRWYAGLELFTNKLLWSYCWTRLCEIPIWEGSAKILGTESKISNPIYETGEYSGAKYGVSSKNKIYVVFMQWFLKIHTFIHVLVHLSSKFMDGNEFNLYEW